MPVKLDSKYTFDVEYYLTHEFADIVEASEEIPAAVEWVNANLQTMIEDKIVAKQAIKEAEAEAYINLRSGRFPELYPDVKPTEEAVKHAVALDARVKAAHKEFAVLQGWVSRLQGLMLTLQSKLDMIRSSEATRRRLVEDAREETRDGD
jgi:hypothetical protein